MFGHAPDIAGVAIAADSMHIQFNQRDFFSPAERSALTVQFMPGTTALGPITVVDHGGFGVAPELRPDGGGFRIDLAGREVTERHYIRLEWQLTELQR